MADLEICWTKPARLPVLEATQIHVWAALLDQSFSERADCGSILAADEVERASRFHFPKDQDRFIRARTTLRTILASYLQIDPRAVRFDYGRHGKPALTNRQPDPPIHFNLSHSDEVALIAVTRVGPVGVDVERIRSMEDIDEISSRFFSRHEVALLSALRGEEKTEAFFDLWTRKEALMKADGSGLTDALIQFDTLSNVERNAAHLDAEGGTVPLSGWTLRLLQPAKGCKGAVAVAKGGLEVVTGRWG